MKYLEAMALARKARNRHRGYRLPGREGKTRLIIRSNGVAIKYVDTDVALILSDNKIKLNSGGWHTKTTRDRINEYAENVRVFTVYDKMFVQLANTERTYQFKDGMIINAEGDRCVNCITLGIEYWITADEFAEYLNGLRRERSRAAYKKKDSFEKDKQTMSENAIEFLKKG